MKSQNGYGVKRWISLLPLVLLAFIPVVGVLLSFPSRSLAQVQPGGTVFLPLILTPNTAPPPPPPPPEASGARINVPHFTVWRNTAVAWFGKVDSTSNYADIRIGYTDEALRVDVHIFDRRTWYDEDGTDPDMTAWDAVSLYLDTQGNLGNTLGESAFRFDAQLRHWQNDFNYQESFQGSTAGWQPVSVPFTTDATYVGDIPNNEGDDRGWFAVFEIPYTSLGLGQAPQEGELWGMAITVHDRDDAGGAPISTQNWPPTLDPQVPSTWNQIHFGLPVYPTPQARNLQMVTIRHKLNGATVQDADVGGHTDCGEPFNPDFFNGWGDANYAGTVDLIVQNQGNLGDWPCFSKIYITFPLEAVPAGKVITSAELVLYQFGNSDPNLAQTSLIQVLTVSGDWDESTLTWNNAPLAVENVSQALVEPLLVYPGVPGVERRWDVSRAVSLAHQSGTPLRLALYDADMAMHSGKYFRSSDVDDFMPEARPALLVTYGDP